MGTKPKCTECHERVSRQYAKSLHARISKKICYSCHNPHYSRSFRRMSGEERKRICLACHDAYQTHLWLPQKQLHFRHLECTSCHALNAEIGMVFFITDEHAPGVTKILDFARLRPFVGSGKQGLVETVDRDGNGTISSEEIRYFMRRLREAGISGASLKVRILVLKPTHNFSDRGERARNCTLCHSASARFYTKLLLMLPEKDGGIRTIPVEKRILSRRGQSPFMGDFYLLGESKIHKKDLDDLIQAIRLIGFKWLDVLGVLTLLACLSAVLLHAALMLFTRKYRREASVPEQVELRPVPVRAWHYIHGFWVILLVLTGVQLRLPDLAPIFATFLNAVNLHNISGAVLIIDYFFWISYTLWTGEFRSRLFMWPGDVLKHTEQIVRYYGYLIFVGTRFPGPLPGGSGLHPFERLLYLIVMLVLIPVQIGTGILLFDVYAMMPIITSLGGLRVVDTVHIAIGYLLISFLILHTYFHTLKRFR